MSALSVVAATSAASAARACHLPHLRGSASPSGLRCLGPRRGAAQRGALQVVAVAKPDLNQRRVHEQEAEGLAVEQDDEDKDLPNWITTKWKPVLGGGWWDASALEIVDPPRPADPEPEDEPTEWEKYVKIKKLEQQAAAREQFEWEQAQPAGFAAFPITPLDFGDDIRLKPKHGEKMDWTDEEIQEFIGPYSFEPLTVYSKDWNYDYNAHLCPSVPETHEWMEIKGLIRDDDEFEAEALADASLQEDFSDFDNSKVTMSDMSALDIGDSEEEQGSSF